MPYTSRLSLFYGCGLCLTVCRMCRNMEHRYQPRTQTEAATNGSKVDVLIKSVLLSWSLPTLCSMHRTSQSTLQPRFLWKMLHGLHRIGRYCSIDLCLKRYVVYITWFSRYCSLQFCIKCYTACTMSFSRYCELDISWKSYVACIVWFSRYCDLDLCRKRHVVKSCSCP
jgi:hypothetical protein